MPRRMICTCRRRTTKLPKHIAHLPKATSSRSRIRSCRTNRFAKYFWLPALCAEFGQRKNRTRVREAESEKPPRRTRKLQSEEAFENAKKIDASEFTVLAQTDIQDS